MTANGSRNRMEGSKNIPTDMKNKTEKAFWSGSESAAALWLRFDSLMTTPAKKAPNANDTPKTSAEPNAIPKAIASTESVNNSREPVRAISVRSHGTTLGPR